MRIQLSAAFAVAGALLLAGCSGPGAAPSVGQTAEAMVSPTSADSLGSDVTASGNGTAAGDIRLAAPSSNRPTVAPLESESSDDSEAAVAYIDEYLAVQWSSGAKPSALDEGSVGDCVFFDWEYSSAPTTTALFQVPCGELHEGEIFGTVTHAGGAFPGKTALHREAGPSCGDVLLEHLEARLIPNATHQILSPTGSRLGIRCADVGVPVQARIPLRTRLFRHLASPAVARRSV